jgi:hypothetical protein
MPIEIRELQIKVNVNQPQQAAGEGSTTPADASAPARMPDAEKIAADAVEQVMDLLRQKKER